MYQMFATTLWGHPRIGLCLFLHSSRYERFERYPTVSTTCWATSEVTMLNLIFILKKTITVDG